MAATAQTVHAERGLHVACVTTLPGIDAIREEWEELFENDPDANAFLSWAWLRQTFAENPSRWRVLTARSRADGRLVGLFPLKSRIHWSTSRKRFETELEAAGRLSSSSYSGMIIAPDRAADVLKAFGEALADMHWTRLSMLYFVPETRARALGEILAACGLEVAWRGYMSEDGKTDKLMSANVPLPATLNDLLNGMPDRKFARQYMQLRRDRRDYSVMLVRPDNIEANIGRLGRMLAAAGSRSDRSRFSRYTPTIRTACEAGALFMPILVKERRIVAFAAHLLDPVLGDMIRIVSGRMANEEGGRAERLLTQYAIEAAIRSDCFAYDFGRDEATGNEGFFHEDVRSLYMSVKKDQPDDLSCLSPDDAGQALDRIAEFIRKDRHEDALAGTSHLRRLFG
ncbi:hypothetical protein ATO6_14170 [Oceanicola sp. 22II-s10i]|nr:hypothetical protein ATO6_14170 [Oceanicola sp. 22II-s10i]